MRLRLGSGGARVTPIEIALHTLAMLLGLFALAHGIAYFVVGLLPGRSAPPTKQYAWSATALTASYYLLSYALSG